MLPSVVTSTATVACSRMTFSVPVFAASEKGSGASCQGVLTRRSLPSSSAPAAPGTRNPTQSMSRTSAEVFSPNRTETGRAGTNFGSVVMMVLPAADWGSSSSICERFSPAAAGMTSCWENRLMKVDLPVRTGPTTPMYSAPCVRVAMSS